MGYSPPVQGVTQHPLAFLPRSPSVSGGSAVCRLSMPQSVHSCSGKYLWPQVACLYLQIKLGICKRARCSDKFAFAAAQTETDCSLAPAALQRGNCLTVSAAVRACSCQRPDPGVLRYSSLLLCVSKLRKRLAILRLRFDRLRWEMAALSAASKGGSAKRSSAALIPSLQL